MSREGPPNTPSRSTERNLVSSPVSRDRGRAGGASSKLRVISQFAGIGGFDLGLERTGGFRTVAVAELDPYASRILALRFSDAPNLGDVTTAEYPDADIICAGFPCQDISFAGAGAGLAGARSGLFREVVRAVRVVRPRYVILENVAALLGRGLDVVLWELAEVGYDAEWHCIPASAVGAPHRRDRIWIIAHPRGEQHEGGRAPLSGAIAAELSRIMANAALVLGHGGNDNAGDGLGGQPLSKPRDGCRSEGMADAGSGRHGLAADEVFAGRHGALDGDWWAIEPNVGRVAHGIPKRVDRLRCLGNAVVPQIPELIGRAILASLNEQREAA